MADSSPLPIAFCITELEIGGAEQMLAELVVRLDRRQFSPAVYCLGPRPQGTDEALTLRIEAAGVPVRFFNGCCWCHALRVIAALTNELARQQPRILQTFLWHANLLGSIAAKRVGVPHLVAGIRVARREHLGRRWLARFAGGEAERYVCVSRQVAEFAVTQNGACRDRIAVIPNGIDLDRYPAPATADLRQLGLPPGRRALLYVGRLDPQKRVDWLLERMPAIFARLPDHDLVVVGKGRQYYRLLQQAERLGIAPRVHFAQWRSDVPEILAAADLLLLTSAYEGMPNVVLEAMASGMPVVATDVAGVAELLGDDDRQQRVPRWDGDAFVRQVIAIANDADLAARLGRANRRRAEQHFSITRMVEAYQGLYRHLATGQ